MEDASKKIKEQMAKMEKYFAEGNMDGAASLYCDDVTMLSNHQPMHRGKAGLLDVLKADQLILSGDMKFGDDTTIIAGEYLLNFASFTVKKEGSTELKGYKYLMVWKKVGDEYKIFMDMFNNDS